MGEAVMSAEEIVERCEEALSWQALAGIKHRAEMATLTFLRDRDLVKLNTTAAETLGDINGRNANKSLFGKLHKDFVSSAVLTCSNDQRFGVLDREEFVHISRRAANLLLPKRLRMPVAPSWIAQQYYRATTVRIHGDGRTTDVFDVVVAVDDGNTFSAVTTGDGTDTKAIYVGTSATGRDFCLGDIVATGYEVARNVDAEKEWNWSVRLSLGPHGADVTLDSDADGARDFVRRDFRGTTGERRSALVHWVREHFRQRRRGVAPELVRAHLRGRTDVRCGAICAKIIPSKSAIRNACNGSRFK